MTPPVLLDLFCGAGGAAMGYHRAGFEVVGVDLSPMPRFPFTFIQADALAVLRGEAGIDPSLFDVIHASPPCQAYSPMTKRWGRSGEHPDLVEPTRDLLEQLGLPFVIENVMSAPLIDPVVLCGQMFDLTSQGYGLRRHRGFEAHGFELTPPPHPPHQGPALPVYGHPGGSSKRDGLKFPGIDAWREGMGIDWMNQKELAESIPPAFTEFIGRQLIAQL